MIILLYINFNNGHNKISILTIKKIGTLSVHVGSLSGVSKETQIIIVHRYKHCEYVNIQQMGGNL